MESCTCRRHWRAGPPPSGLGPPLLRARPPPNPGQPPWSGLALHCHLTGSRDGWQGALGLYADEAYLLPAATTARVCDAHFQTENPGKSLVFFVIRKENFVSLEAASRGVSCAKVHLHLLDSCSMCISPSVTLYEITCFSVVSGYGGDKLRGILPEVSSPDARHAYVVPVVHQRIQKHLRQKERRNRNSRRSDEHRFAIPCAGMSGHINAFIKRGLGVDTKVLKPP